MGGATAAKRRGRHPRPAAPRGPGDDRSAGLRAHEWERCSPVRRLPAIARSGVCRTSTRLPLRGQRRVCASSSEGAPASRLTRGARGPRAPKDQGRHSRGTPGLRQSAWVERWTDSMIRINREGIVRRMRPQALDGRARVCAAGFESAKSADRQPVRDRGALDLTGPRTAPRPCDPHPRQVPASRSGPSNFQAPRRRGHSR